MQLGSEGIRNEWRHRDMRDGRSKRFSAKTAAVALIASALLLATTSTIASGALKSVSHTSPPSVNGYWEAAADGGIFAFNAPFAGSMGGTHLNQRIVGMAADPATGGYWEVASDGGIFSFNAPFQGSMGGTHLNQPIIGMAFDPATGGYWEVASDGGLFSFNAPFQGSMGGTHLNQPIVGMAADPATGGYWEVASDGGIFSFNAPFQGSMGGTHLNQPIVGMAASAPATGVIAGVDYGPLVGLIGTWKSAPNGGVDVAPGQVGSPVGPGGPAVSPYYETITYTPAGEAVNASEQHLAALYYRQQVFTKSDNKQFHDQTGYLIYDKIDQKVYDTFCIPRGVCVVAEGAPGTTMTLKTQSQGVAETQYMLNTDRTDAFSITFTLSENTLKYEQTTDLQVYGKPFSHTDSDTLEKTGG